MLGAAALTVVAILHTIAMFAMIAKGNAPMAVLMGSFAIGDCAMAWVAAK